MEQLAAWFYASTPVVLTAVGKGFTSWTNLDNLSMSRSRSLKLKDGVVNFSYRKFRGQGRWTDWLPLVLGTLRGQEGRKSPEKQQMTSSPWNHSEFSQIQPGVRTWNASAFRHIPWFGIRKQCSVVIFLSNQLTELRYRLWCQIWWMWSNKPRVSHSLRQNLVSLIKKKIYIYIKSLFYWKQMFVTVVWGSKINQPCTCSCC